MDEYERELQELRRTRERLAESDASSVVIAEYDAEIRNLTAILRMASELSTAGTSGPHLREALAALGYGTFTFEHVYSFVYDEAISLEAPDGDLATALRQVDMVSRLMERAG